MEDLYWWHQRTSERYCLYH